MQGQLAPAADILSRISIEQENPRDYHGSMLNWWHRLSLQIKVTLIVIFIVGVSAGATDWLEARSIQHIVEDNVRAAALAVGYSVDQNVTSRAQLSNREARTKELEKIFANLPDLSTS